MERQTSLFDDETPAPPDASGLILTPRQNRPLTKAQRTFNRLVARVDALRAELDSETRRLDQALAYYGQHLHPRLLKEIALRKECVRALAPFFKRKQLKRKREREALRMLLADQLDEIIEAEGSLTDPDLRALFERIYGVDVNDAARQEMEDARAEMESLFDELGIEMDLSDLQADMTAEAFAAKAAQMEEQLRQKEEAEEGPVEPPRRKTRKQLEKEQRLQQAEELRKKSISTIYKQLAKVLHPDLEPDVERRQRKAVLMQELTSAYRNNDLHTLLRLELEWINREEGDLDRLSAEKLAIYNQGLKDQVQELERQLADLPLHPRYQPLVVEAGPFEVRLETNGPEAARGLDEIIVAMEESLVRLRTPEALQEVQAIVQEYSSVNRGY